MKTKSKAKNTCNVGSTKRTLTETEKKNQRFPKWGRVWIIYPSIHPSIHPSGVAAGWQGEFANCHRSLTLFRQVTALRRRFSGSSWLALRTKENYRVKWNFIQPRQTPVPHMLSAGVLVIHDIFGLLSGHGAAILVLNLHDIYCELKKTTLACENFIKHRLLSVLLPTAFPPSSCIGSHIS